MNLVVGIQGQNPHLRVLKELLNHQGVIFEERIDGINYPCIIQTNLESIEWMENDNVIVVDKIIPMERIITIVSGELDQNLNHPDINKYEMQVIEEIRKVMYSQGLPLIRKWFWPHFEKTCFIMTHDIDRLSIPPINARHETPNIIKFFLYISYYYKKYILRVKKFEDYIGLMIKIEEKYKVKSSFYFFSEYEEHEEFINILNNLKIEKFEVGLHSESENYEQLKKEKLQLEEYYCGEVFGTRQHLLKFSTPQTWQYQERLLEYDLTFYRNEEFGYRSGICFPYRPLNTETIIEIPTLFMDWTALNRKMKYIEMKEELQRIVEVVESYNGCVVFNFHNEYFNKIAFPHIYKLFIYVLESVQKDCWITTANECVKWWKERGLTKINVEFKNGNIVGTSSNEIPIVIEYNNKISKYLNLKKDFIMEC